MAENQDVPILRETPGGWLATSPGDFPAVGVIAPTADEAAADYRASRRRFRELLEIAKANPVPSA